MDWPRISPAGDPQPNFADKVKVIPDGKAGPGLQAAGDEVLSWQAGANIFAQRGTLSFVWRARDPIGHNPFPLFRVGYADHTSWDMVWLRMDWNGHGIDAFVTDDNLARVRVSYSIPEVPRPDQWTHLALSWDETTGIRLYVNGVLVARKDVVAVLDSGLDQFGPHSRIVSPHQVQSAYSYLRGGDLDEIRIYDHALDDGAVATLARNEAPNAGAAPGRDLTADRWRNEWWLRYGWNRPKDPPPYLADAATRIRKVEFTDARDLKERMTGANDGIAETTWPGVYNRSRLPGRHDYYELPDWNVYVEGGKSITFTLPQEPWNRLEFQGAAYGHLTYLPATGPERKLADASERAGAYLQLFRDSRWWPSSFRQRRAGDSDSGAGGLLRDSRRGTFGRAIAQYTIRAGADPAEYPTVDELTTFINGRLLQTNDRRSWLCPAAGLSARLPRSAPRLLRRCRCPLSTC